MTEREHTASLLTFLAVNVASTIDLFWHGERPLTIAAFVVSLAFMIALEIHVGALRMDAETECPECGRPYGRSV